MHKLASILLRGFSTAVFLTDSTVRILFSVWEIVADAADGLVYKCEKRLN